MGKAARLSLAALRQSGRAVSAIDLAPALMQPSVVPLPDLPPPRPGPGTLLLLVQPPSVAHSLALIGSSLLNHKLRIGFWAWELEQVPAFWTRSRRYVHALLAPSRFCRDAYERAFREPVRVACYPVAAFASPRTHRHAGSRPIRFGAAVDLGSTTARKNPIAIIQAFHSAFRMHSEAVLYFKVRNPTADPAAFAQILRLAVADGPPIHIETRNLDRAGLEEWWSHVDVLVSLHRSEGFGLVPAEAMQRGIPVISTDWSATSEFVTAETGWPVPATFIPVSDLTGYYAVPGARWANPDIAAAAAAMTEAAGDQAALARKGRQAALAIENQFSVEAFLQGLEGQI
jgi:glycosyltransferase involved in cell wall biosynthesis